MTTDPDHATASGPRASTSRPFPRHLPLGEAGQIDADGVCAWFSGRLVLETVT